MAAYTSAVRRAGAEFLFLSENFDLAGFFPVRVWRRRLRAVRGSPPCATAGGGGRDAIRTGQTRLTPVAPDALQLRAFGGTAHRVGQFWGQVTHHNRAQVSFSVGQYQDYD